MMMVPSGNELRTNCLWGNQEGAATWVFRLPRFILDEPLSKGESGSEARKLTPESATREQEITARWPRPKA